MRQFKVTAEMLNGKEYTWEFYSSVEANKMKDSLIAGDAKWLEYKWTELSYNSTYIRTDHISEVRIESRGYEEGEFD